MHAGVFTDTGGEVKTTTDKTLLFSQMDKSEKAGIFYVKEGLR